MSSQLKLTDITKKFEANTVNEKVALDHLNLTVEPGQFVTVLGSNGSGKSTMFNVILGSLFPDEGKVYLGDKDITKLKDYKRALNIGCLYQNPLRGTAPNLTIEEKLDTICKKIYHANGLQLTANAVKQAKQLTDLGFDKLPICMAKTQYSFSDDASLLGAPRGFTVTVRNLKVSAGAGFIVALTGDIMTMPGLPKVPSAEKIDVDENGRITGLF